MAASVKIPFDALTSGSVLALLNVNTATRVYGADGKAVEGVVGDPKIEVAVMDSLDRFTVSVKSLDAGLAAVTAEQIETSLKTRNYINVELTNAFSTPFPARTGFGVTYSTKADSARIATAPQPMAGFDSFPKPTPTKSAQPVQ
jgi:hypothetical protein